jgi:hypothetical protein
MREIFCLSVIPYFRKTKERMQAIRGKLKELADDPESLLPIEQLYDLTDLDVGYSTKDDLVCSIMDSFEWIYIAERDVTTLQLPGMDYIALATGGLMHPMCGDPVSESITDFQIIESLKPEIWDMMLQYAREDYEQFGDKLLEIAEVEA